MDFRLKVFRTVAELRSFTRAAKELHISQPAISKHINELEQQYKVLLFDRHAGKISLTHEGEVCLKHVREILDRYDELAYNLELISGNLSGELRIGASSTIAQYLISPILANFIARFPSIEITLESGNSSQIESLLEEHKIDLGLVEGGTTRQNLRYSPLSKDELVLVTSYDNPTTKSVYLSRKAAEASGEPLDNVLLLESLPLVLRESGSGTLEVIAKALQREEISLQDLNILIHIGSTEGIKSYLQSDHNSYAIISIISLLDELKSNRLRVVDIYGADIERQFQFVTRQGGSRELVDKFINFATYWVENNR